MDGSMFQLPLAKSPGQMNPIALAYMGDAVYSVYIRHYVLGELNHRPSHIHTMSTKYVAATAQAKALHDLIPHLSEEELAIVKRGRNAKSGSYPKSANVLEYRLSTALECLIGYLYLTGKTDRLSELLAQAVSYIEGK